MALFGPPILNAVHRPYPEMTPGPRNTYSVVVTLPEGKHWIWTNTAQDRAQAIKRALTSMPAEHYDRVVAVEFVE